MTWFELISGEKPGDLFCIVSTQFNKSTPNNWISIRAIDLPIYQPATFRVRSRKIVFSGLILSFVLWLISCLSLELDILLAL